MCGIVPADGLCWNIFAEDGLVRHAPSECALLVVTDERGAETVFGFLRYPEVITDSDGREIMRVPDAGAWRFGSFVDSPDPRYRALVAHFRAAGYLASELDEYRRPALR